MESQIDLTSEIKHIENFKTLLEKYKDFKSCLRDIKISTVLGQKCLFEIEDINPPLLCDFSNRDMIDISQSAISIKKLSFKIDDNMNIISLTLNYEFLQTKMGKLAQELINNGIEIKILAKSHHTSQIIPWQVYTFYISNNV